ncbi:Lacal_2735 family protein [Flavobacteriaceae bacterium]|nr:Lacal_2735 family protein [Flavobacteriaceae bacterium]
MFLCSRLDRWYCHQDCYKKLMSEWHELSTTNRSASDAKYAEAQGLLDEIDKLNS